MKFALFGCKENAGPANAGRGSVRHTPLGQSKNLQPLNNVSRKHNFALKEPINLFFLVYPIIDKTKFLISIRLVYDLVVLIVCAGYLSNASVSLHIAMKAKYSTSPYITLQIGELVEFLTADLRI